MTDFLLLFTCKTIDKLLIENTILLEESIFLGQFFQHTLGTALAIALGSEPLGINSVFYKIGNNRLCTFLRETFVILVATPEVAVRTNLNGDVGVSLEQAYKLVKLSCRFGRERSLVKLVEDIVDEHRTRY